MNDDSSFFDLLGIESETTELLSPQLPYPNPTSYRENYINAFAITPVYHGTTFDNGTRWCEGCDATRTPFKMDEKSSWKQKSCPHCEMIWPEYEAEFKWKIQNDPDFMDEVDLTILMPWDIN